MMKTTITMWNSSTPASKSPFLYEQALGRFAQVCVTRCDSDPEELRSPYSGNLALHVNDAAERVQVRRIALERQLDRPVQWLNQVHGTQLIEFTQLSVLAPTADASLTASDQLALGILTADCLPVVFASSDGTAIAAAHAGWRGLQAGILGTTWTALRARAPHGVIYAHLGPCIGQAQFEVGGEVFDAFTSQDARLSPYFTASGGKYIADLTGVARHQLRALGVAQITGGGWCTVSDLRLASYRRSTRLNQPSGRFATVVALRQQA